MYVFSMNVTQIQIYLIYDKNSVENMAKYLLQTLKLLHSDLCREFRDFQDPLNSPCISNFLETHDFVDFFTLIFQFHFHLGHAITFTTFS